MSINTYIQEQMDRVKNSTIAKLTSEEAQNLGLANIGFGFYRGELKTRCNGIKRTTEDNITFTFETPSVRLEFTELVRTGETREWAARIWNKNREHYETYPMGITGCDFLRVR